MCFAPKIKYAKRRAISSTIDDYPGSINDLNGCNNDGRQLKETFLNFWPDFDIIRLIDSKATVGAFTDTATAAGKVLKPGSTILVLSDSCFSGSNTRLMGLLQDPHPIRNRFHSTPGVIVQPPKIKTFAKGEEIKWIAISGCGETQYSADAYISGDYHGAFTWFAMNTLVPGMTYFEWYLEIRKYLPSQQFEQAPTIEGPGYLLDRKVFEDDTLVLHNSTHGTQLNGTGDEPTDEAICFYNGNFRDNDYGKLLYKIAA